MVIVGGRKFASRTPTIIERERIRKIRRIFRVGGRKFADRTPTIIETGKDQVDPEDIPCRRAEVRKPHADDHRKGVFEMLVAFMLSNHGQERSMVLPELQYHALLCLHSTKLEAPRHRRPKLG